MALYLEVTNNGDVAIGRDEGLFQPGETTQHTASGPDGLREIDAHPDLSVKVVDVAPEDALPVGFEVEREFDATPDAKELAEHSEVDLAEIEGSGLQGRIIKSDVESYIKLKVEEERVGADDSPEGPVTSEDPPEKQAEVMVAPRGIQRKSLSSEEPGI